METIERSGDHLLTLVNEVLDISRIEAGAVELHSVDFDLQVVLGGLDEMFRMRCEQKGLGWHAKTPAGQRLLVGGDQAKLTQVLTNLLGNAVKFTDKGSVRLVVSSSAEGRYRFEVSDTGAGISPEVRTAIFEPFRQTEEGARRGGTGLGLSIAQKLLEVMGSRLELESAVGEGSRFFFELPLAPGETEVAGTPDRWTQVRHLAEGSRATALVVDDVPENREVLARMLTDIGVEVTLAEGGREAMAELERAPPDMALLDIRMPEIDGQALASWIWERFGRDTIKVVAVSASTLDHERQEYLELGFDSFIGKPVRIAELFACLADLLGVEYEYHESVGPSGVPAVALQEISLPADLLRRLRETAEFYQVTELRNCLPAVAALGPEGQRMADFLKERADAYDMAGILRLLDELSENV